MDHESTLIACCILNNALIDKAILSGVRPDWFNHRALGNLWEKIINQRKAGKGVDLVWITDYLDMTDIARINRAVSGIISLSEFDSAYELLKKRYIHQRLRRCIQETYRMLRDDSSGVIDETIRNLEALKRIGIQDQGSDVMEAIKRSLSGIVLSWGWSRLDAVTHGVSPSLMVVAGDSGHLKTTFALNLARNLINRNVPVCYFTGEMSHALIIEKLTTMETGLNTQYFIPVEEREHFLASAEQLLEKPLTAIESTSLPRIRMEIQKKEARLYIIDYLNIVRSDLGGGTREREISYIIEDLARLRLENEVCILLIAALNRGERERNMAPTLRNLKDSSSIEYGADFVLFTYYKWRTKVWESIAEIERRVLRTHMAKNRITGVETRIDFEYSPQSLVLTERENRWWEREEENNAVCRT